MRHVTQPYHYDDEHDDSSNEYVGLDEYFQVVVLDDFKLLLGQLMASHRVKRTHVGVDSHCHQHATDRT